MKGTENEKLINTMSDYDKEVVTAGLSILLKTSVKEDQLLSVLERLSEKYGGTGLVTVMEVVINQ